MVVALKGFIFAMLLAASSIATAAGLGFLAESPLARFNEDDLKLMNAAMEKALTATELGMRTSWVNDKTGSSGEVTPQRAFESRGRPCRELRVVNRHRALEASGVYTMCREDGRWNPEQ